MERSEQWLLQHLGANLRKARSARTWSQQALAEAAGVSRRMLVSLEAGDANVSFATVERIAQALQVTFAELIHSHDAPQAPVLTWKGALPGSHAVLLQSHGVAGAGSVELWQWRLAAGDSHRAARDPLGYQEILYVIDGHLTLKMGNKRLPLAPGASHLFATHVAYAYVNDETGPCVFLRTVIALPSLAHGDHAAHGAAKD